MLVKRKSQEVFSLHEGKHGITDSYLYSALAPFSYIFLKPTINFLIINQNESYENILCIIYLQCENIH